MDANSAPGASEPQFSGEEDTDSEDGGAEGGTEEPGRGDGDPGNDASNGAIEAGSAGADKSDGALTAEVELQDSKYYHSSSTRHNDDFDFDGLLNAVEVALGTDPYHPDSDRDGIQDADEVALGTDPVDKNEYPSSIGNGNDNEFNDVPTKHVVTGTFRQKIFVSSPQLFSEFEALILARDIFERIIPKPSTKSLSRLHHRLKETHCTIARQDLTRDGSAIVLKYTMRWDYCFADRAYVDLDDVYPSIANSFEELVKSQIAPNDILASDMKRAGLRNVVRNEKVDRIGPLEGVWIRRDKC
mmetsp:Transcript_29690/g.60264  ORF Transcript_29690/g.60264 Transcript_29690/m.60264 type:complete len:300 (+) Transcript_29690:186-1085(+)